MFFQPIKEECILEPLTNLAAKMQCSLGFVKFIANVCEETTKFFFTDKVMLEIGVAAYT